MGISFLFAGLFAYVVIQDWDTNALHYPFSETHIIYGDKEIKTVKYWDRHAPRLIREQKYENDILIKETRYQNGNKTSESHYVYGDKNIRTVKSWDQFGRFYGQSKYENGHLLYRKAWYENGQLQSEHNYEGGKRINFKTWNEDGTLIKEEKYENGVLIKE
ncbi:MAG TPA: hypothetical protein EYN89_13380 [Flavobacteriales bacterium]|nr:hypothetical protein [Flavobacteriales bacterium]